MKRISNLWPQVTAFENLYAAYQRARRGKGDRVEVARFGLNLERELIDLQRALTDGSYRPGGYRQFTVYERKPRLISAAPFRDRVVHHASIGPLEPLLDRRFIIDSGGASEAAVRGFPGDDLLTPLERPTGMPIGNLTSQVFANLYLDDLDHWLKDQCRMPAYLRYVDDMVVLGDDKRRLAELREAIRERLALERLHLHPRKAELSRTRDGLDLLGYRVFPDFIRLRDDNGQRFARRLRALPRACLEGRITFGDTRPAVASWIGHAGHADSLGLRRAVLRQFRC